MIDREDKKYGGSEIWSEKRGEVGEIGKRVEKGMEERGIGV